MHDAVARLYRIKLILACLVLVVLGAVLIAVGSELTDQDVDGWPRLIPWSEIGGVLVGAGLLSVWLDAFFRREQDEADDLRLRQLLHEQAPAMRDAVLEAFAANHDDLKRVATPAMLDQVISNSLALRLEDPQFAAEVYRDIRDQAVLAQERWHDATVSIDLSPIDQPVDSGHGGTHSPTRLFAVTVRWEYTTIPHHSERRFVCTSDRSEYAELSHERGATSAWYLKPTAALDAGRREAYELLQFSVNGEQRPIRRSARKHGQLYTANVGIEHVEAGKPVTIAYTYRTVTTQHGHLLYFDIEQPTRHLSVELDYSGCEIANVSVLDLVASVRPTRVERTHASLPSSGVRVELDGWIFPRSGVAFVWILDRELPADRHLARTTA